MPAPESILIKFDIEIYLSLGPFIMKVISVSNRANMLENS